MAYFRRKKRTTKSHTKRNDRKINKWKRVCAGRSICHHLSNWFGVIASFETFRSIIKQLSLNELLFSLCDANFFLVIVHFWAFFCDPHLSTFLNSVISGACSTWVPTWAVVFFYFWFCWRLFIKIRHMLRITTVWVRNKLSS